MPATKAAKVEVSKSVKCYTRLDRIISVGVREELWSVIQVQKFPTYRHGVSLLMLRCRVHVVCIIEISVFFIVSTFRINLSTELPYTSDRMEIFSYIWDKKYQL